MVEAAITAYVRAFGRRPQWVAEAPGRINLIGDHTDYNEGFVMPMAIAQRVAVAARLVDAPSRLVSELAGEALFDARTVKPGDLEGWAAYPAGVAWALGGATNLQAAVVSKLAMGQGVSSSAAVEVAFAALWNAAEGRGLGRAELAKVGQRAENEFVGVRCGLMDQLASALGRAGCAMLLDMRSLACDYVPIPDGLTVLRCDTGAPRKLTESAYNERRSQCESAAARVGLASLRDASFGDLDRLDGVELRRARHVVTENARVVEFAKRLGDDDRPALARLMAESHASLRDDYEASAPSLDAMAEACAESAGCVGSRMTGAGFGGSCVSLVEAGKVTRFVEDATARFARRIALKPTFEVCEPFEGVRVSEV